MSLHKTMRYTILCALIGALITYLAGAFCAASFDIAEWTDLGRIACACLMACAGSLGGLAGFNLDNFKRT